MRSFVILSAVWASLGIASLVQAQKPSLYLIDGFSGAEIPEAFSMSPDGRTIVGAVDADDDARLFRWTLADGMQDIGRHDIFHPRAIVSLDGRAVVGRSIDDEGDDFPFRWTVAEGMRPLPDPSDGQLAETNVGPCSRNGRVLFGALVPRYSFEDRRLLRWIDDEVETFVVEGINDVSACSDDGSVVYGYRFVVEWPGYSLFRWTPETGVEDLFEVEEGIFPESIDATCSPDGSVVTANVTLADDVQDRGVVWTASEGVRILEGPPGMKEPYDTIAYDCSDDGSIVVGHAAEIGKGLPGGPHVWFDGVPVSLQTLLANRSVDLKNWELYDVKLCSADGTILVGSGRRYYPATGEYEWGEFRADIVEPVPALPNRPPVAKAGKNVVVRTKAAKARVRLDGTESRDPDGDKLVYLWTAKGIKFAGAKSARPSAAFPVGKTTVKLTVTDARGVKRSDTVTVTIIQTRQAGGVEQALDDADFVPSL